MYTTLNREDINAMEVMNMIKAAEKQAAKNEELVSNTSFLGIAPKTIAKAIALGKLTLVAKTKTRSGSNEYYSYNKEGANMLLIHVGKNQYVLASQYIQHGNKTINVARELSKFTWSPQNVGHNRDFAMGGQANKEELGTKTPYMHRVLMMLEMFGDYGKLNPYYDIHHKGACFDNRTGCTMYIPRKLHKHSTSHMIGGKVKDYEYLVRFLDDQVAQYDSLCKKTIIE